MTTDARRSIYHVSDHDWQRFKVLAARLGLKLGETLVYMLNHVEGVQTPPRMGGNDGPRTQER